MCFRNDCNGLEDFACDLIQMLLLLPESDALCMHRFELQANWADHNGYHHQAEGAE